MLGMAKVVSKNTKNTHKPTLYWPCVGGGKQQIFIVQMVDILCISQQ